MFESKGDLAYELFRFVINLEKRKIIKKGFLNIRRNKK